MRAVVPLLEFHLNLLFLPRPDLVSFHHITLTHIIFIQVSIRKRGICLALPILDGPRHLPRRPQLLASPMLPLRLTLNRQRPLPLQQVTTSWALVLVMVVAMGLVEQMLALDAQHITMS